MDNIIYFYSDSRGIYIPRDFALDIDRTAITGISEEQYSILEDGPYNEFYWEVWDEVIGSAEIHIKDKVYSLHQDGDLWLIDYDAASEDELNAFFGE